MLSILKHQEKYSISNKSIFYWLDEENLTRIVEYYFICYDFERIVSSSNILFHKIVRTTFFSMFAEEQH